MFARSNSQRLTAVLIAGACVCMFRPASAAEPAQSPEERRQEIAQLIEQLASKDPKARTIIAKKGGERTVFPQGFRPKKKEVSGSAARLKQCGIEAFPQLIDHFDDRRYSYSTPCENSDGDRFYTVAVGEHCRDIVEATLYRFDKWGQPGAFGPTWHGLPEFQKKETAQQWWAKNKDKPLWRLQADILQWAIDLELKTKQVEGWQVARSKEAVEVNQKRLRQILASQKPL